MEKFYEEQYKYKYKIKEGCPKIAPNLGCPKIAPNFVDLLIKDVER